MKSTYKNLFRIAIVAITAVLFCAASCEKSEKVTNNKAKDTNPYSETRNEALSMIGFKWNGNTFMQLSRTHLFTAEVDVSWNTVEINNEKFIIIHSDMVSNNGGGMLNLLLPYQDIELNKTYTTTSYSSIVGFYLYNPLVIGGEERLRFYAPLTVTVVYTKNGNKIQGSFSAEGNAFEASDSEAIRVTLQDGLFNLSNIKGLDKNYTLDKWLLNVEQTKNLYH
ncbi:MAG: hypothetical protein J6Z47_03035 [Bacteroidales bacterium]|nr:hypothetical protein [Bacteroidales bacterium]